MRCVVALSLVVVAACPARLPARPAHKQAAAQYFGDFMPKKLNDCRLCHLPDPPTQQTEEDFEKPHNAFGLRLKEVRDTLRRAGQPATLEPRLDAILKEDSDGDGVDNLTEILLGRHPGDPKELPAPAETAQVKARIIEFAKSRSGYRWRPFETVQRPALPAVKNANWVRNPIDAFIAAEHEALGLVPRPTAPPEVLLRRLYLDLIGLPPTPAELHAFLDAYADTAPQAAEAAYQKTVDRLLDDPRHGERWARHWMDIWRYSDWAGFGPQIRDSQPHIWRWRDWIVDSLNRDKPYDRMVLEMLAGDELAPADPQALAATGYLVRNWKLLSREKWLQDTVEHTAMAFLGLTVQCAKCHDHMYDPITQVDYYQLRAIFEPHLVRTDRLPGQLDVTKDGLPRVYDGKLDAPTFLFVRGDDRNPDKSRKIPPAVFESLSGPKFEITPVALPRDAYMPDKRAFVLDDLRRQAADEVQTKRQARLRTLALLPFDPRGWSQLARLHATPPVALEIELADIEWRLAQAKSDALDRVLAAERLEDAGQASTAAWQAAARAAQNAQRRVALLEATKNVLAARKALTKIGGAERAKAEKRLADAEQAQTHAQAKLNEPSSTEYQKRTVPTYPTQSTGRRLALARWIADRNNPLTARVAVNHLWTRHFGQGLVPTTFDFGKNGRPPSHPALLDWLAAEFMQSGSKSWSMKQLHRLIVTSNTYRLASTPDAHNGELDRDNKYLWRFPMRRLEAEVVRDAIWYVAGKLDLQMGGPDIDYPLGLTVPRRSLYFRHAAEKQMEFLTIFDAAAVTECYERKHAIVPQQALALLNSELTLKQARILARALAGASNGDARAFTVAAFEQVLSRPPTAAELAECLAFLSAQTQRLQTSKLSGSTGLTPDGALPAPDPALRARENLVHVLLNHHEFVTIR